MTRRDFYKLAREHLAPADLPDHWGAYRAGRMTHFEALRAIFESIRADEGRVLDVVSQMELEPGLAEAVSKLRSAGWELAVASAGCEWYIRRLLASEGIECAVHANPGRYEAGRGLLMELPRGSPYFSSELGIDKAAVVRAGLAAGRAVAFAGDGFPDLDAARAVPAGRRFARADLAAALGRERLEFRPFARWPDIADALLEP
jgi:2-hydroxy-3-keto-5-methylthiopentenyl-1-phosphate phosphatase